MLVFGRLRIRFAYVLSLVVLCLLVVFGMFLKVWRTTPTGFTPLVRVSVLDILQARALENTAVDQMADGRYEEALFSLRIALANNPGDISVLQNTVTNLAMMPYEVTLFPDVVNYSRWLLKLSGTNIHDLEAVVGLFDKYRSRDAIRRYASGFDGERSNFLEKKYLIALFDSRLFDEFVFEWEKADTTIREDTELMLYRHAVDAIRGGAETGRSAWNVLSDAVDEGKYRVTAARLMARVCVELGDIDDYRIALRVLENAGKDRLIDHVGLCRLYVSMGRTNAALDVLDDVSLVPDSPREFVDILDLYFELGRKESAEEWFKRYLSLFESQSLVWVAYGDLLVETEDWDEVERFAVEMRNRRRDDTCLTAYSYYLQGRAAHAVGRDMSAAEYIEKAAAMRYDIPRVGVRVAEALTGMGYEQEAYRILDKMRPRMSGSAMFWETMFSAAGKIKNESVCIEAAECLIEIAPGNLEYKLNYAIMLMLKRERLGEALALTLDAVTKMPAFVPARLNHCLALLLNQRILAASEMLSGIRPEALEPALRANYDLCRFYLMYKKQKFDEALEVFNGLDKKYLFPSEVSRLNRLAEEVAAELS
ncbi:MAG: hypothetical protein K9N48_01175 [Verrucomicrobia bacterium]|nr:hypothetical protein [Verrucomicrobiota bacterium]MCF7707671.1 hypothetical protein [Verrucomicrobiota bacterium]